MMEDIVRIVVVCEGILILFVDFFAFVYRKLTEGIGLGWGFFACIFILLGIVPGLSDWTAVLPVQLLPALGILQFVILAGMFYFSMKVSELLRKNQELAMHVSLINQENERILGQLKRLRKEMDENKDK